MTHTYSAGGSRQPTVFAAIIALHLGIYFAIVSGLVPRLPSAEKKVPPVILIPRTQEPPVETIPPANPGVMEGLIVIVEQPDTRIPKFADPTESATRIPDRSTASGDIGSGPTIRRSART